MQENKWLSMKEVCAYLHISRDTVMNWIKKEGMPAHQKGRLWHFDVNEVGEWMKIMVQIIYPMPKSFWIKNIPIAYGY